MVKNNLEIFRLLAGVKIDEFLNEFCLELISYSELFLAAFWVHEVVKALRFVDLLSSEKELTNFRS